MSLKIIKGDLISLAKQGHFHYIAHGANCFCKMGAGIALQIAREFPEAKLADDCTLKGSIRKLGDYSIARMKNFAVVNLYTQYKTGPDFTTAALELALYKLIIRENLNPATKLGIPWIGCGIGGCTPHVVLTSIQKFGRVVDLTVVEYDNRSEKGS